MFSTETFGDNSFEQIFSKELQISLKDGNEEKKISLNTTLEKNFNGLKREILLRLTNENNLNFFYNLTITEDDFQMLKSQQGLLVDFSLFPQKLVDLLNLCAREQHKEHPRYFLSMSVDSFQIPLDCSSAVLNIVESNPFKHLIHLSLKLISGNDREIKKYLVSCLQKLKNDKFETERKLESSEYELRQKCEYIQELLSSKTAEVEKLKVELRSQNSEISLQKTEQLNLHQTKLIELKKEYEMKVESMRIEYESKYQRNLRTLEDRAKTAESENEVLSMKARQADADVKQLRSEIVHLEPNFQKNQIELHELKKDQNSLNSKYNDLKELYNNLKAKFYLNEQELKETQNTLASNKEVLQITKEQKVSLEKQLEEKATTVMKREGSLKILSDEVKKANEIITKLQKEIKSCHSKLKIRNQIATEQEKMVNEKEELIKRLKNEISSQELSCNTKDEEISKLKLGLQEAEKHLKTNENVISWLNKQLNGVRLTQGSNPLQEKPQPRLLNYYDSYSQPIGSAVAKSSKMQTPTVTFAPHRTEVQSARPVLGEQYFRRSMPISQSTPHIRSSIPVIHESKSPNGLNIKNPSPNQNNLQEISKGNTENQPPSSYFARQAASS